VLGRNVGWETLSAERAPRNSLGGTVARNRCSCLVKKLRGRIREVAVTFPAFTQGGVRSRIANAAHVRHTPRLE
jgi:hypothetical protein